MNKFRMRTDVLNYSLGGMGCSAGLISVDVAQRVLQWNGGDMGTLNVKGASGGIVGVWLCGCVSLSHYDARPLL